MVADSRFWRTSWWSAEGGWCGGAGVRCVARTPGSGAINPSVIYAGRNEGPGADPSRALKTYSYLAEFVTPPDLQDPEKYSRKPRKETERNERLASALLVIPGCDWVSGSSDQSVRKYYYCEGCHWPDDDSVGGEELV